MKSRLGLAAGVVVLWLALSAGSAAQEAQPSTASADLEISIEPVYDPAVAGRVQIYDVEIVNHGPADAHEVLFDYEPAAEARLAGVRPQQGSCSSAGRSLACDLGAVAAGQTVRLSLGSYVDPRMNGALTTSALISSTTPDPDETNNEATVVTPTVRARAVTALRGTDGTDELVVSVKESDTTIGLVFVDPRRKGRRTSVSSPGYRAVALTQSVVEDRRVLVALGYGFDGSAVLDVIDPVSSRSVAQHPLRKGLVPIDLVPMPRAPVSSKRPAVAVLALDPVTSSSCLLVIDQATGAERSRLCTPDEKGAFPIGLALLEDGSQLALLTSSTSAAVLRLVSPDAGGWGASLTLAEEGLPLAVSASDREFLILSRAPGTTGTLRVRLANDASLTSKHDLAHPRPEALAPLAFSDGQAPGRLVVAGRESDSTWLALLSKGGTESRLGEGEAAGEEGRVCLGLVHLRQADDSDLLALIHEHPSEPTEVALFDLDTLELGATLVLP